MRSVLLLLVAAATASAAESAQIDVAEDIVRRSLLETTPAGRWQLTDEAALICRKILVANPRESRAYHLLADALAMSDPTRADYCRPTECAEAVDVLKRGRAQDPFHLEERAFSFELGIVLSRLGRFEEALAEYDRGNRLETFETPAGAGQTYYNEERRHSRAILHGNAAESLMALGRLEESIARYRRAEELGTPGEEEWELAEWGLGVALDRDGQSDKAAEAIERALGTDPTLLRLRSEHVFFEPPGDIDYYVALGHEVAYRLFKAPLDRARAIAAWRRFVAHPSVQRPFLERARRHLVELAPSPTVTVATIEVAGVAHTTNEPRLRADAEMATFLNSTVPELQFCVARAQAEKPGLAGQINLLVTAAYTGEVEVQILQNPMSSSILASCVQRAVGLSHMPRLPTPSPFKPKYDMFVAALRISP